MSLNMPWMPWKNRSNWMNRALLNQRNWQICMFTHCHAKKLASVNAITSARLNQDKKCLNAVPSAMRLATLKTHWLKQKNSKVITSDQVAIEQASRSRCSRTMNAKSRLQIKVKRKTKISRPPCQRKEAARMVKDISAVLLTSGNHSGLLVQIVRMMFRKHTSTNGIHVSREQMALISFSRELEHWKQLLLVPPWPWFHSNFEIRESKKMWEWINKLINDWSPIILKLNYVGTESKSVTYAIFFVSSLTLLPSES